MTYEESIEYINTVTDALISRIDGQLRADNMDRLSISEHCLLAYRYLRDEVMEGGFIQLIQNGYGPYVLLGPFPMLMKKEWGLRDFGLYLFEVGKQYKAHRAELEADKSEDEFMAQYEQYEELNEMGDDFLDIWEETVTPLIAAKFRELEENQK